MELQYLVREPDIITPETTILFMLHGYGSNEKDLFSFVPTLPKDWIVVSYRAPRNSDFGGYSWYNIDFQDSSKFINVPEAIEVLNVLLKSMSSISKRYRLSKNKIHICGFSQGGILTYALALRNPELFTKVVCLSAYLEEKLLGNAVEDKKKLEQLRFFISHGINDSVIPLEWAKKAADLLYDKGCYFTFREYMSGHGVNEKNYLDLMEFFKA